MFNPQCFLGLDEMNLRVLSWRRLGRRDRPGVRQIRCEPDSGLARWCRSCGACNRRGRARVAPRRVRRPVRDRDRRFDPACRWRARPAPGHGAGPFYLGAARMVGHARRQIQKTRRDGHHGRVRRLKAGRRIRATQRGRGRRPVPHHATGRRPRHQGALPPASAASGEIGSTTAGEPCSPATNTSGNAAALGSWPCSPSRPTATPAKESWAPTGARIGAAGSV